MDLRTWHKRFALSVLIVASCVVLAIGNTRAAPAASLSTVDGVPGLRACGTSAAVVWSPSSSTTYPNTSFSLKIYVNVAGGGQADGADVTFSWNSTYLSVLGIAPGAQFPDELYKSIGASSARYASGKVSDPPPAGSIHMATVTFRSKDALVTNTPLTFGAVEVSCAGNMSVSKGSASVAVVAPPPTATRTRTGTPTLTPTVTSTPTPVLGNLCVQTFADANRNGLRDVSEALVAGSMITVTDVLSNVVATYTTNAMDEPRCFSLLPATYHVDQEDPPGYSAPIPDRWKVVLSPLDTVHSSFGVVLRSTTGVSDAHPRIADVVTGGPGLRACGTSAAVVWSPSSYTTYPNTSFSFRIYVNVAGGGQADGVDLRFSWNASYLSVQSVVVGSAFPSSLKNQADGPNTWWIAAGNLSDNPPAGSILFATVTFRSLAALVTNTPLTFGSVTVSCGTSGAMNVSKGSGSVAIVAPPPTATRTRTGTPTLTPTVTSTPTPVTADLCVLAYRDANDNNWREGGEELVSGESISVTNAATGVFVGDYTTNGREPYCFQVLPGSYLVWGQDPPGYGGRRPEQWGAGLGPLTVVEVGFGLRPFSGETPSATPTTQPAATATASETPTNSATATETPTATHTLTNTATATCTPTAWSTPTASATATPTPSATVTTTPLPTSTPTTTPAGTQTASRTTTQTPSVTPTRTITATATQAASATPSETGTTTATATLTATKTPTPTATGMPPATATYTPTETATQTLTTTPTATVSTSPEVTETPTSTPTPVAAETTATATATPPAATPVRYSVFLPCIVGDNPGRIFLPYTVNDLGEASTLILPILQVQ